MSKIPLWVHILLALFTGGAWLIVPCIACMCKYLKKD